MRIGHEINPGPSAANDWPEEQAVRTGTPPNGVLANEVDYDGQQQNGYFSRSSER